MFGFDSVYRKKKEIKQKLNLATKNNHTILERQYPYDVFQPMVKTFLFCFYVFFQFEFDDQNLEVRWSSDDDDSEKNEHPNKQTKTERKNQCFVS